MQINNFVPAMDETKRLSFQNNFGTEHGDVARTQ